MATFRRVSPPQPQEWVAPRIVELSGAVVTRFDRRPTERKGRFRTRGAVYTADGHLVPESQRVGGISGDHVRPEDPPRTDVTPERELRGNWLYAGNWMAHFGHFITETLTTLWPREHVDGVLAHPYIWSLPIPTAPQLELTRAAGHAFEPVIVRQPLRVERLLVPTRPFVTNGVAADGAVHVWERVARAAPSLRMEERIFFSRSRFHAVHARRKGSPHRRSLTNEPELDQVMRSCGFAIIHPQELGVLEQVGLAAAASILAGVSGTALHLSAFSGESTRVLELTDARSPAGLPNQRVIAAARRHRYAALPLVDQQERSRKRAVADLDGLLGGLEELGLLRESRGRGRRWRRR